MGIEAFESEAVERAGRFWPPFAAMMLLTPLFLLIGIASSGAGHGNYFLAKLLFPFTMLSTLIFDIITVPFLIIGLMQFPAYGVILGLMNQRAALVPALIAIVILHVAAAATALCVIGETFS